MTQNNLEQIPNDVSKQQDQFGFDKPNEYETESATPLDQTYDNMSQYSNFNNQAQYSSPETSTTGGYVEPQQNAAFGSQSYDTYDNTNPN
jgi:hypothetical protein